MFELIKVTNLLNSRHLSHGEIIVKGNYYFLDERKRQKKRQGQTERGTDRERDRERDKDRQRRSWSDAQTDRARVRKRCGKETQRKRDRDREQNLTQSLINKFFRYKLIPVFKINLNTIKQWIDLYKTVQSQFKSVLTSESSEIVLYLNVKYYITDPCKLNHEITR